MKMCVLLLPDERQIWGRPFRFSGLLPPPVRPCLYVRSYIVRLVLQEKKEFELTRGAPCYSLLVMRPHALRNFRSSLPFRGSHSLDFL
jgi:hypothetical protein